MKVYYGIEEAENKIKNAVVTTGSFDGVHSGHVKILDMLNKIAGETKGESVLITFEPHPRKILYPNNKDFKLLNSRQEKIYHLEKTGLNNLIIHPFSAEFSKTTSYEFIAKYIVDTLKANVIVVGSNHHFGHNREGDFYHLYELRKKYGFKVVEIPLQDIENESISSVKVRKALIEGNIQKANKYLDYKYSIIGKLISVEYKPKPSNTKIFQFVMDDPDKLIPKEGLYSCELISSKNRCSAKLLIKKVFENQEVYLRSAEKVDLKGRPEIKVVFLERVNESHEGFEI